MNFKLHTILLFYFLLSSHSLIYAQIQPTNAHEYNIDIRFHRSFGTIGSDGAGNDPDPTWQIAVANDTNSMEGNELVNRFDLLDNTPNVLNPNAYCWWTTTSLNGWHDTIDESIEFLEGNVTGFYEVEVMSYENDCIAQFDECIYHVGVCADDDDNMLFENDVIGFKNKQIGAYHISEIDLEPAFDFSKLELKYAWRHTHGSRRSPLTFGKIEPGRGYSHTNSGAIDAPGLLYSNDWTDSEHPNFKNQPDITYTFELVADQVAKLTFVDLENSGRMHLVLLNNAGDFQSYRGSIGETGILSGALLFTKGKYALVLEGSGGDLGAFAVGVRVLCNNNDLLLSDTIALDQYFETNGTIISDQQIMGGAHTYDAIDAIELNSGFQVNQPAEFLAFTEGCKVADIEGNLYRTVRIGDQEWMSENLRTSSYNDGTPIPNVTDPMTWESLSSAAWCYYDNDPSYNFPYGKLYNWYAIDPGTNGNKNVCPSRWHVPTEVEWMELSDYLGSSGGKMKEFGTTHWNEPNNGANNLSGFTGLPYGERQENGSFAEIGNAGVWWSVTPHTISGNAYHTFLQTLKSSFEISPFGNTSHGFAIRCLRD